MNVVDTIIRAEPPQPITTLEKALNCTGQGKKQAELIEALINTRIAEALLLFSNRMFTREQILAAASRDDEAEEQRGEICGRCGEHVDDCDCDVPGAKESATG